ncbi:MAG: hypothetical protein WCO04_12535 [Pseudomonadota bacterium]
MTEPRQMPSQGDAHEALIALVRLIARAEARRWLAETAKGVGQTDADD